MEKCPSTYWALKFEAYLPTARPADFFNQSLCVPSLDLATTPLVSLMVLFEHFVTVLLVFNLMK